jgi:endonuclease V-like protein UPF0215 family
MRAAVAIPAAARWTDRRAIAVRFAMLNMVASLGVENDGGDVSGRGSRWWSEVKEAETARIVFCTQNVTVSVFNLRRFRIHPTDGPITLRPL